jgi:holo-[acyl-carrier protein] synthase
MIHGIGTDIVEISRIEEAFEKWGVRFLEKIFTEKEILYCYGKNNPFPHLAARFAAKEAMIKALSGLNVRSQESKGSLKILNFKDVEIINESSGKPFINNADRFTSFVIHLSMSHERSHAIATVILERRENQGV